MEVLQVTKPETEIPPDLANRDDQALALREGGCTYLTIAKELGMETATLARKGYLRALKRRSPEEQEILRRLELRRFDALAAHIASRQDLDEPEISRRSTAVDLLKQELLRN